MNKTYSANHSSRFFTFSIPSFTIAAIMVGISAIPVFSQEPRMINEPKEGTCRSGDNLKRVACYFPSKTWSYNNALAVEYTGGSGADVYWYTAQEVQGTSVEGGKVNAGLQIKVVEIGGEIEFKNNGNKLRTIEQKCIIGSPEHNQQPYCQNPFRGSPVMIRVVPHNNNWKTDFVVHNDPEIR